MTPVQFAALLGRKEAEERMQNYRAGVIASTIANIFCKLKEPLQPLDFFDVSEKEQTPEEQLKIVELLNEAFEGRDLRKKKDGR